MGPWFTFPFLAFPSPALSDRGIFLLFNMSDIYQTEPPTSGKVILHTSFGDVDVELWCKEAPIACRNFIQLSM